MRGRVDLPSLARTGLALRAAAAGGALRVGVCLGRGVRRSVGRAAETGR
ncbi:MAG: hypothetical protein ACPIOQ_21445 [Promethearchaeia archaeon]